MDYAELVTECALRSGLAEFPARAASYVRQAERDLEKLMTVRQAEAVATLTTDAEGKAPLPADFLRIRDLPDNGSMTVQGDDLWTATQSGDVILYYFAKLPSVVENSTNWLLDLEPEIYCLAVLAQAYSQRADERMTPTLALLKARVDAFRREDKLAKHSGQRIDVAGLM